MKIFMKFGVIGVVVLRIIHSLLYPYFVFCTSSEVLRSYEFQRAYYFDWDFVHIHPKGCCHAPQHYTTVDLIAVSILAEIVDLIHLVLTTLEPSESVHKCSL